VATGVSNVLPCSEPVANIKIFVSHGKLELSDGALEAHQRRKLRASWIGLEYDVCRSMFSFATFIDGRIHGLEFLWLGVHRAHCLRIAASVIVSSGGSFDSWIDHGQQIKERIDKHPIPSYCICIVRIHCSEVLFVYWSGCPYRRATLKLLSYRPLSVCSLATIASVSGLMDVHLPFHPQAVL
jgi:hypothetical protein